MMPMHTMPAAKQGQANNGLTVALASLLACKKVPGPRRFLHLAPKEKSPYGTLPLDAALHLQHGIVLLQPETYRNRVRTKTSQPWPGTNQK